MHLYMLSTKIGRVGAGVGGGGVGESYHSNWVEILILFSDAISCLD